jgi:hypothetical protein
MTDRYENGDRDRRPMSDAERMRRYRARQRGEVEGNEPRRPGRRRSRSRVEVVRDLLWALSAEMADATDEERDEIVERLYGQTLALPALDPFTRTVRDTVLLEQYLAVRVRYLPAGYVPPNILDLARDRRGDDD